MHRNGKAGRSIFRIIVIILGFEYGGSKETEEYQKAQAIKYIE